MRRRKGGGSGAGEMSGASSAGLLASAAGSGEGSEIVAVSLLAVEQPESPEKLATERRSRRTGRAGKGRVLNRPGAFIADS